MTVNLSNWLRKTPQPAAVLADDKRIEVGKNVRAYRDLLQTIKSLEPAKLTCLDGNGSILRSLTLDSGEDDKPALAVTPEMTDVQLFAKLLAEAYEHTQKQPLLEMAMQFVERQGARLAKAEAEIDRLRSHIHKLNGQITELSLIPVAEGGDDSLMGALVAGAMQAAQQGMGLVPTPTPTPITKPTGVKK
jgi:hypothetical protein